MKCAFPRPSIELTNSLDLEGFCFQRCSVLHLYDPGSILDPGTADPHVLLQPLFPIMTVYDSVNDLAHFPSQALVGGEK